MKLLLLLTPGLLRDLPDALRFLTVLPVPGPRRTRSPAESMAAFPLAGAVIGLLLVLLDWLLQLLGLAPIARDALLVACWVALTGGVPLDGLVVTCDGLFEGADAEQRLAMMRDGRVGSYGMVAAICTLMLRFGLLSTMYGHVHTMALILAPMLGRWAIVQAALLFPGAVDEGMVSAFRVAVTPQRVGLAAATCLAICFMLGGTGILALIASYVVTWRVGRLMLTRIPGLTADTVGAIVEINEVLLLLVCAIGLS